jgi:exoribonuclease-2
VSVETAPDGGIILWVHVADPAASVTPGSPADVEARARGATSYLPEGTYRMLGEGALEHYALGVAAAAQGQAAAVSPALSFKITLASGDAYGLRGSSIAGTEIMPSFVRVTRLTYEQADAILSEADAVLSEAGSAGWQYDIGVALRALDDVAAANTKRRVDAGAVVINFPEVHINVDGGDVSITPMKHFRSQDIVRECMLLAGEGAAQWALGRALAFPYISQEVEGEPEAEAAGLAASFALRKTMRARTLGSRPGFHAGLGLAVYTQVTSPLRRYTDLLAHQQIRAVLEGRPPLDEDALLERVAAAERAALATVRAERASRAFWTAVYLKDKAGAVFEGVLLDKRGPRGVFYFPALGLETQCALPHGVTLQLNDAVHFRAAGVNIAAPEIRWTPE